MKLTHQTIPSFLHYLLEIATFSAMFKNPRKNSWARILAILMALLMLVWTFWYATDWF
jgi:hypothetical protein